MRALAFLLALLLAPVTAPAQPVGAFVQGPTAAGSYQGVGDIVSAAGFYGGVWAYTAATRGTKALNVCNTGGCADVSTDATTGQIPATLVVQGNNCASVTCTVATIYDKSGNGHDFGQNTSANRATLTNSGCPAGANWCLSSGTSTFYTYGSVSGPSAQPVTASVVLTTTSTSTEQAPMGWDASPAFTILLIAGSSCGSGNFCSFSTSLGPSVAISANTWYAIDAVFNGSSPASSLRINGTTATGSTSGMSWGAQTGAPVLFSESDAGNNCAGTTCGMLGKATEFMWWTSALTSTQQANIESNERASNRNNF